jgi:type IV pilus assembly protein PilM
MAKKVTTLFIEDTSIRLLETKGKQVIRWASAPLEPGLVSGGVINDENQVAERLKELLTLAKINARKVTAGLSGLNSLYRLITLPQLPDNILPEAVKREATRIIPVPPEEVYLSHQRLPGPAGEIRVFLAAFPRNNTDALIRTLRLAGVEPKILDLSPLALCRVVSQQRAIIVNVRSGQVDLIVLVNRVPQVIRSLSLHGESESLSDNIFSIAEELERTVAFYNSNNPEEPLDTKVPVMVSGDLAEAPDTWQTLLGNLRLSASVLPSPMEYPESFPANEFMVNIGLSLKDYPLDKEGEFFSLVDFNALPEAYRPMRISLTAIATPVSIVVAIGVLVFLFLLGQNAASDTKELRPQLPAIESQNTQLTKQVQSLREQVTQKETEIAPVQAIGTLYEAKITSLGEGREIVCGDLEPIANKSLLGHVLLLSVSDTGGSATVRGTAPRRQDIFSYARYLRLMDGGRFSSVLISSITYNPQYYTVTETVTEIVEGVSKSKEVEREVKIERYDFTLELTLTE